jgi:putative transposase
VVDARVCRSGGRPDPAQVVTLVEAHRHTFGVAPTLAAIGEPVSTFCDRTSRRPSVRAVAHAALAERTILGRSRRSYRAPRIHAMLAREGVLGWPEPGGAVDAATRHSGTHLRQHWKPTQQDKAASAAPDLVERNFTAAAPSRLWVADLT